MLTDFLLILFIILIFTGLYKLFIKAGEDGWKALVPGYNFYIWLKITGRPVWWLILLLIPFINVLVLGMMVIDLLKSFGKFSSYEFIAGLIFPFVYFPYLAFGNSEYIGKGAKLKTPKEKQKTGLADWVETIVFASVVATAIHLFIFQPYVIPTSSMEKSLLVGDYILVSKIHYGPRLPITPISFPLVHNQLPFVNSKSYIESIRLPFARFRGFQKIKNNDIVVFNYPNEPGRPVDKKDNYVKRCIGIPGDTLVLRNSKVFINGQAIEDQVEKQHLYTVTTAGVGFSPRFLKTLDISEAWQSPGNHRQYSMMLTEKTANILSQNGQVASIERVIAPSDEFDHNIFPHYQYFTWNVDNFGPLYIPGKGDKIDLTPENFHFYKQVISEYEKKGKLELIADGVYLNGQKIDSYTFEMDYYFMMGDNRNYSSDSRMWGFVPEDHIVGKPVMIWFSMDREVNRIRFNRIFSMIN